MLGYYAKCKVCGDRGIFEKDVCDECSKEKETQKDTEKLPSNNFLFAKNDISNMILEVANLKGEIPYSDLQGIALAKADDIIKRHPKYDLFKIKKENEMLREMITDIKDYVNDKVKELGEK